jgi:hypothetical protein
MPKTRPNEARAYSLTPEERETIILMSDADDTATIATHQQTVITRLRKNPAAKLLEEGHHGTTAWARFEIPAKLLSFRTGNSARVFTEEQRKAIGVRLRRTAKAA